MYIPKNSLLNAALYKLCQAYRAEEIWRLSDSYLADSQGMQATLTKLVLAHFTLYCFEFLYLLAPACWSDEPSR